MPNKYPKFKSYSEDGDFRTIRYDDTMMKTPKERKPKSTFGDFIAGVQTPRAKSVPRKKKSGPDFGVGASRD